MNAENFTQEFNSLSAYLRGFAMNLTRNKSFAEDLFQETAFAAFKNKDKFRPDTNMKAWLSTIMKNSFINHFRKRKRRLEIWETAQDDFLLNNTKSSILNEGESNVQLEELRQLVNNLNEGLRIPFQMAYEGYKYNEICETLGGIPMGTIKSRIHQARKLIKEQFATTTH